MISTCWNTPNSRFLLCGLGVLYACTYACMHVSKSICMHACIYLSMHACIHACMYARTHVCTHVRMYACTYVRKYKCTYACTYVCTHACIHTHQHMAGVTLLHRKCSWNPPRQNSHGPICPTAPHTCLMFYFSGGVQDWMACQGLWGDEAGLQAPRSISLELGSNQCCHFHRCATPVPAERYECRLHFARSCWFVVRNSAGAEVARSWKWCTRCRPTTPRPALLGAVPAPAAGLAAVDQHLSRPAGTESTPGLRPPQGGPPPRQGRRAPMSKP